VANDGQVHHPSDANDAKHLSSVESKRNTSRSPIKWMPAGGRLAKGHGTLTLSLSASGFQGGEWSLKKQEEQEADQTTHC
jgi:hypothetical protein